MGYKAVHVKLMVVEMEILNENDEQLLVRKLRSQYAKQLLNERNIFKQGAKEIISKGIGISINVYRNEYFSSSDLEFHEINSEYNKATLTVGKFDTPIVVEYDTEPAYDHHCSDCGSCGEYVPSVLIYNLTYKLFPISYIRKYVRNRIKDCIRDANFKFKFQPNGKDVRRYLRMIEIQRTNEQERG